jgi:hypothetical protein
MVRAESWAKDYHNSYSPSKPPSALTMFLMTVNPVAVTFYKKLGYRNSSEGLLAKIGLGVWMEKNLYN